MYTIETTLDSAGAWQAGLQIDDGSPLLFSFQVNETAAAPIPGQPAPRAASPTTTETLDVDPLCTQNPPCPLHERSLDTLIGAGRPVAVLFATPARCETAYCGPVLEVLLPLVEEYGDRIDFVHVEIYKDSRSEDPVPTVAEWNLPSEPWLFGVDSGGTIVGRVDGAFDRTEMRALLDDLSASA